MQSNPVLGFLASLLLLFGFFDIASAGYGSANLIHYCPYNVYCSTVVGCAPGTPAAKCPGAKFNQLAMGTNITVPFQKNPSGTGVTIMCTRDPSAGNPLVTQLEWTWEQGQGKTYFDISNVAGHPFVDEGFILHAIDKKDPKQTLNNCHDIFCKKGDLACNEAYEKWDDDEQAMRACYDDVIIGFQLCL
ncbi:hypothetical protein H2200_001946 [Cladophialophora chaetospira]|uniref:Uncharacterized protein n=1 Tax=Cladophialophora chaetospira TaxID=386627 RepID=A0AA38XLU2_9EURO|nr:hypothetical protein H2200_001946 [Cladophialophora chaetospira]